MTERADIQARLAAWIARESPSTRLISTLETNETGLGTVRTIRFHNTEILIHNTDQFVIRSPHTNAIHLDSEEDVQMMCETLLFGKQSA